MTVSSETNKVSYAGNGSTTDFSTSFVFLDDAHILVTLVVDATGVETTQTITTEYTLVGAGTGSAGTVTMLTAPASGETLIISRNISLTQETDYVANDPFPAETHEEALDKLTMIDQQQQEELSRSIRFPLSVDSGVSNEIPTPTANYFLKFNSTGDAIEAVALSDTGTQVGAVTYENLNANGDVGTGADQVAAGNHNHSGTYEPAQTAASQAEMEAGSETALRSMSPLRVKQAITALSMGIPAGSVLPFAMSSAPSGYLECDGTAISRSTYSDLFSAIGTTFGTGDGSTTFNIPDLRGEFIRGWDHGKGTDSGRTLGSSQSGAIESHSHGFSSSQATNNTSLNGGTSYVQLSGQSPGANTASTDTTGVSETRPRNIALMYCIKY